MTGNDEVWYRAPDWVTTNPLALTLCGLASGAVVAYVLIRLHRRSRADVDSELAHIEQISFDVINFSHLQVVGFGGFALVFMCAMVAIVMPPVGLSLAIGAAAGTIVAILLIVRRGKAGPISSSSRSPGANTTLHLDDDVDGGVK
jgi:uncharacterized transporter YbjL